jgi:hypothetical protein
MSHLKLVVTNTPRKRRLPSRTAAQRRVPALVQRILDLPLAKQTIGALLTDAVNLSHDDGLESSRRYIAVTIALAEVGILMNSVPSTHGLVFHSWVFISRYPEFKGLKDQLDNVLLTPPVA